MSRSTEIKINNETTDVYLSGKLAEVAGSIIGTDRIQEQVVILTKAEVLTLIFDMVTEMSKPLLSFTYQGILERQSGYGKVSILMLWHQQADARKHLTFC